MAAANTHPPKNNKPYTELAGALHMDPWASKAACAGRWDILECRNRLPDGRRDENEARVLCHGCPVRDDCLEWVLVRPQHTDPEDMWILGGLNPGQRRAERHRRRHPAPVIRTEKPCTGCKQIKSIDGFGPDKRASDGRTSRCRVCIRKKNREYEQRAAQRNKEVAA
jgi:WhiB family redox-sensing transcriptional regulator